MKVGEHDMAVVSMCGYWVVFGNAKSGKFIFVFQIR